MLFINTSGRLIGDLLENKVLWEGAQKGRTHGTVSGHGGGERGYLWRRRAIEKEMMKWRVLRSLFSLHGDPGRPYFLGSLVVLLGSVPCDWVWPGPCGWKWCKPLPGLAFNDRLQFTHSHFACYVPPMAYYLMEGLPDWLCHVKPWDFAVCLLLWKNLI